MHLCHILAKICHSSPSQSLLLEKAPLQGLAAEKLRVVLEMAPLQGLAAGKLGLILEMAPLQGLGAEKWEMTGLCHVKRPAVVKTSPWRYFHSLC